MSSEEFPDISFKDLLTEPVRNGIYKEKEFHGRGCKIINMGELFGHPRMFDIPMKRVELNDKEMQKFLVRTGDLVFARRSLVASGAGRCSIVKAITEPTTFESSIIRARPDPNKVSSDYLYYYFSSPLGRQNMGTILRQVAVSGITGSDLMELSVPCPDLPTQLKVAGFLSLLDDRIALLQETNTTLEAIAQALFKSWFVHFDPVHAKQQGRIPEGMDETTAALFPDSFEESELGLLPKGWIHGALSTFCTITSGKRPNDRSDQQTENAKVPLYGGAGVMGFTNSTLFNEAKIVTGRVGTLGKVHIAYPPFWASDNVLVITPKMRYGFLFAFHWINSIDVLALNRGSTQPLLTQKDLGNQIHALPDDQILRLFASIAAPIFDKIELNRRHIKSLAKIRDALLPRLISGTVVDLSKIDNKEFPSDEN